MKLKKRKSNRNKFLGARANEKEYNVIKLRAGLYAEGNMSEWLITAGMKYKPAKEDIE